MSKKCVFENMGTEFSSLATLEDREPKVCEDQLKK